MSTECSCMRVVGRRSNTKTDCRKCCSTLSWTAPLIQSPSRPQAMCEDEPVRGPCLAQERTHMAHVRIDRLTLADLGRARELFLIMAGVFETRAEPLTDAYLARILGGDGFW